MIPIHGQPVLTAAEMRAAEQTAMTAGTDLAELMRRAGEGVAEIVRRLAADASVLVLCGPGNNGGDGWIAAATLARAGVAVRVAALGEPQTDLARAARAGWTGPVEELAEAEGAPVVVDALFGTGLSRSLPYRAQLALGRLVEGARLSIAADLPSGIGSDNGTRLGAVPLFDLTLALGAVKPAHLLQPGAHHCGTVRLLPIGVDPASDALMLARPALHKPGPDAHKYSRGMVAVVAGAMAGAAQLAATAAMRAGAGYVALLGGSGAGGPHALVHKPFDDHALADKRIGALLIGPGLGRNDEARVALDRVLATDHLLVVDGDALHLLDPDRLADRERPAILTPHAGEFDALFGKGDTSKLDRARAAARRANATVVFKGADTVIAVPDGRVRLAPDANSWLSTAGTGDVLAGTIAAMLAAGVDPLDAAAAGVWLHGEAARRCGASFIADDLAEALSAARASL